MIFFKHVFIIKLIFLAFINFSNAETEDEKRCKYQLMHIIMIKGLEILPPIQK